MSVQGQILDITVIGCRHLRDTEIFSRQDPYVVLEYAGTRYRTRTDTDGGRNPTFNEQYRIQLVEGLREINVSVWNSNTLTADDMIGVGRIYLQKALCEGYDDSSWPLTTMGGRRSGEVRIVMHYKYGSQNAHAPPQQYNQYTPPPQYPPPNTYYAAPPPPPSYPPNPYAPQTYPYPPYYPTYRGT